ncbi:MAG: glycosyltransferase [candidate division Zixibacteria bacterium]|nr:glycosyltransferase [candidate division Zixibacteria bacterium]
MILNSSTADISIVTANYNNGEYLRDFIESVINSTILPGELIIIDDGSTDNSIEILKEYEGLQYLRIIEFESNRGFAEALNAGIEVAGGKYIMRVDPDDILIKNRIEKQWNFMNANPEIDVSGSNVIYFNSMTKKDIIQSNFPITSSEIDQCYRRGEHGIQHPTAMIRSLVMKKYKYYQESVPAEDFDIFARMIKDDCKFANIPEPLLRMRIHSRSVSSNLKFDTIRKTYELRDNIFGTNTSVIKVRFYYLHMLNYRKFLISKDNIKRFLYLFLAILFYPQKLLRRIRI